MQRVSLVAYRCSVFSPSASSFHLFVRTGDAGLAYGDRFDSLDSLILRFVCKAAADFSGWSGKNREDVP
jgi:hypothetical protein